MPIFAAVSLAVALVALPQEPPAAYPPSATPVVTVQSTAPVLAQEPPSPRPASGLPRRAPEPQTMGDYWPVFAALALVWIGIIGYLLVLGRRSQSLARTLYRVAPEEGEAVDRTR